MVEYELQNHPLLKYPVVGEHELELVKYHAKDLKQYMQSKVIPEILILLK